MASTNNSTAGALSRYTGTWRLDPAKTTVDFRTKAMWVLPVKGIAKALSGEAQIGADGDAKGTLVIDAGSFDTKNKRRDDHLRTADFFEVVKYPTITFTADSVRSTGAGHLEVDGVLTVHGRSQPVTLKAEVSADGGSSATVATEVEIDRSLFGLSWSKMGAGLKNQVTIRAHFNRA
jgi:polyisoprenoid-binding protein YceI